MWREGVDWIHVAQVRDKEQSPSWQANRFSASQETPHFMEPLGSSPYSQQPATCLYPKPDRASLTPGSYKWSPS